MSAPCPKLRRLWGSLVGLICALGAASPAWGLSDPGADRRWYFQFEGHASLFTDVADRSLLGITFGPSIKLGHRLGDWGVFFSIEHNAWVSTDFGQVLQPGALNLAVGGEYIYANGHLRASLAVGPSVLLYETALDDTGSIGIFVDARPVGLRWPFADWFVLMWDPLSVAVVAPVLDSPALILVEYRSVITTEFRW